MPPSSCPLVAVAVSRLFLPSLTHGATKSSQGMGKLWEPEPSSPSSLSKVHRAPRATGNGADKRNLAVALTNGMEFSSQRLSPCQEALASQLSLLSTPGQRHAKDEAQRGSISHTIPCKNLLTAIAIFIIIIIMISIMIDLHTPTLGASGDDVPGFRPITPATCQT